MSAGELTGGTYELLRERLRSAAKELRERLDSLNRDRTAVFGNIETKLLATERITTEHNCIPRDLVAIEHRFLFGFNIQFGLKSEFHVPDVFALYRLEGLQFRAEPMDSVLGDKNFVTDFASLYRFYKNTFFSRFHTSGPFLYMVFQVGKTAADIKAFKWRIEKDSLVYIDNRSEHEVALPPQHEFTGSERTANNIAMASIRISALKIACLWKRSAAT